MGDKYFQEFASNFFMGGPHVGPPTWAQAPPPAAPAPAPAAPAARGGFDHRVATAGWSTTGILTAFGVSSNAAP